jgi:hypothetical protein
MKKLQKIRMIVFAAATGALCAPHALCQAGYETIYSVVGSDPVALISFKLLEYI